MINVSLSNITLILGARRIFAGLNWEIQHDQKIGLIGPNGAGKSSLLKLIHGDLDAEPGGAVMRAKGITVGYLPQQPTLDPQQTALSAAMAGNPRFAELQAELEAIETGLGDPQVYNDLEALARWLERQERCLVEYAELGGDGYPGRVREFLRGLGLQEVDFDTPAGALSGGQKKLVGLTRLLLARPDVLLLDEPDNHLDLAGKAYLEALINDYPGPVVIVSHDRYLLDAVVTHIAELEDGVLSTFEGDYSGYVTDKELRLARHAELYHVQQREIARLETTIKRYAMWGKVYDNEKFAKRAKTIQGRLDRMEKIERPVLERRKMDLKLNGWRGSNKVLEIRGLKKSFTNHLLQNVVLDELELLIWHGERVGLIGPNGAGKSVLLRLILAQDSPDAGEIRLGPSVKIGHYAQEHETLDPEQTPLDAVRYAGAMSESNAVAFLIRYLFTYRQASQKIAALSGGERSRLQLALLVLSGANFLLLDEPTNNLDVASAEVLENALEDFEGTVLVVSHDRYFLDRAVNRILVIEGGKMTEFAGGYSDYAATRYGALGRI
jgi:ATP-binding cassette, subfamily F, member 3